MMFCSNRHITPRTNTEVLRDNICLLCCRGSHLLACGRVADIPAVRHQVPSAAAWPPVTLHQSTCGEGSQPACASRILRR